MVEYVVQKNDTIAAVKERFEVSWKQIQRQNPHAVGKMRESGRWFLKEGARLTFENMASKADTTTFQDQLKRSSLRVHEVRADDTVWELSRTYGVDVESIADLNGLKNPDLIRVGQILSIPESRDSHPEKEPVTVERLPSDATEAKARAEKTDLPVAGSGDEELLEALAGDIMPMPLYTGELSIPEQRPRDVIPVGNAGAEDQTPSADKANSGAVSLAHSDPLKSGVDLPLEQGREASSSRFSVASYRRDDSSRSQVRVQYRPAENTKLFLGLDYERYRKSAYVDKESDLDLSVLVGISLDF